MSKRLFSRILRAVFVGHFYGVIAFYVEQPHEKGSALYKRPTNH
jgi:hypothetical protein